jgi:lipopolysaccharide biosynthesis regulator YciM
LPDSLSVKKLLALSCLPLRSVFDCGYLELGMLDDAALALEEIEPEDKTRTEVLGARIALYITAKKWGMAAAVASHLVKVEPETKPGGSTSPIRSDGARA